MSQKKILSNIDRDTKSQLKKLAPKLLPSKTQIVVMLKSMEIFTNKKLTKQNNENILYLVLAGTWNVKNLANELMAIFLQINKL